jgi:sulfur-oxidizing protein SoxA
MFKNRFRFLNFIKSAFIYYVLFIFFNSSLFSKNLISGYYFSEPSTQEIQDDDFLNPGLLWVERGKKIWLKKKAKETPASCHSCHGNIKSMKGVSLNYPKVYDKTNKLINMEQQINICRKERMNLNEYEPEAKNLLALSAAITFQSRGLDQKMEITKKNKKWFDIGKSLYYQKVGQMGLSCNQCHNDRVGMSLRAEKVSQGQINGFPSYLLRWSKIVSVHRRFQFCNEQARALPFNIFSDEYNALQLYLTNRGNGLKIETPSVRK